MKTSLTVKVLLPVCSAAVLATLASGWAGMVYRSLHPNLGMGLFILVMGFAVGLVVTTVLYQTMRRVILAPLRDVTAGLQCKDLTHQVQGCSQDEIGRLGTAYNQSNTQFRAFFQDLAVNSDRITSGTRPPTR
jgi:methyl-accepting chemotaxis protein